MTVQESMTYIIVPNLYCAAIVVASIRNDKHYFIMMPKTVFTIIRNDAFLLVFRLFFFFLNLLYIVPYFYLLLSYRYLILSSFHSPYLFF